MGISTVVSALFMTLNIVNFGVKRETCFGVSCLRYLKYWHPVSFEWIPEDFLSPLILIIFPLFGYIRLFLFKLKCASYFWDSVCMTYSNAHWLSRGVVCWRRSAAARASARSAWSPDSIAAVSAASSAGVIPSWSAAAAKSVRSTSPT